MRITMRGSAIAAVKRAREAACSLRSGSISRVLSWPSSRENAIVVNAGGTRRLVARRLLLRVPSLGDAIVIVER